MTQFAFELGDEVQLATSGEKGTVIGRSEHQDSSPQYNVRYLAGDGCQRENWWPSSALKKVSL